jgi:UDP-3-O-[3-hydroxymyristoyl] glucosamine N-acyltransferase
MHSYPTVIEDHVKIDELVHVAHNVGIAKGASVIAGTVIGWQAIINEEARLRDEFQDSFFSRPDR